MSEYQINVIGYSGQLITQIERHLGFRAYLFAGQEGGFHLDLPGDFPLDKLPVDALVEFNRSSIIGGGLINFMSGIIRDNEYIPETGDVEFLRVSGSGPNEFLARRIVAFAAGSSQAQKTDTADDMMKEVVSENLKAAGDRGIGAMFTVASDEAEGPSITKGFAWRNVLTVLQDISLASREAGNQVFFDVQRSGLYAFVFRTFVDQIGADRTFTTGLGGRVFSKEFGNLANIKLSLETSGEVNYVYAGGQGIDSEREIVEVSDATRIERSPYNRREAFQQAVQHKTTAGITGEANERLGRGHPKEILTAEVLDAPGSYYGVDWNFGDKITAQYNGRSYNGMIYGVSLDVDDEGAESIVGYIRAENLLTGGV